MERTTPKPQGKEKKVVSWKAKNGRIGHLPDLSVQTSPDDTHVVDPSTLKQLLGEIATSQQDGSFITKSKDVRPSRN